MASAGHKKILIHVLGILGFMSFPVVFSPDIFSAQELITIKGFRIDFAFHLLLVLYFYFSYFVLIDRYYFKEKYLMYFGVVAALFIVSLLLSSFLGSELFFPDRSHRFNVENPNHQHRGHSHRGLFGFEWYKHFIQFVMLSILAIFIRTNQKNKTLQKIKSELELSNLKTKLNPHFLFNTLNGIYSLALEKSEKTAPAIVKLSGMMRYLLEDAEKDQVLLKHELAYINDYIELQRMRMSEDNQLVFQIDGSPDSHKISPMVLMTFIENAFKYGVNPNVKSIIKIHIVLSATDLNLDVFNTKSFVESDPERKAGKGLDSTLKILETVYGGKYDLHIDEQTDSYHVKLKITYHG